MLEGGAGRWVCEVGGGPHVVLGFASSDERGDAVGGGVSIEVEGELGGAAVVFGEDEGGLSGLCFKIVEDFLCSCGVFAHSCESCDGDVLSDERSLGGP